jgi:hypothetical protein
MAGKKKSTASMKIGFRVYKGRSEIEDVIYDRLVKMRVRLRNQIARKATMDHVGATSGCWPRDPASGVGEDPEPKLLMEALSAMAERLASIRDSNVLMEALRAMEERLASRLDSQLLVDARHATVPAAFSEPVEEDRLGSHAALPFDPSQFLSMFNQPQTSF